MQFIIPVHHIYTFIPIELKTYPRITSHSLKRRKNHGQTYAYDRKIFKNLIQDLALMVWCDFVKSVSPPELKLE